MATAKFDISFLFRNLQLILYLTQPRSLIFIPNLRTVHYENNTNPIHSSTFRLIPPVLMRAHSALHAWIFAATSPISPAAHRRPLVPPTQSIYPGNTPSLELGLPTVEIVGLVDLAGRRSRRGLIAKWRSDNLFFSLNCWYFASLSEISHNRGAGVGFLWDRVVTDFSGGFV
jgi:hypothetical protein